MTRLLTDYQLKTLIRLAVIEFKERSVGNSAKELAKKMRMEESNFSSDVIGPLRKRGFIEAQRSPNTRSRGRPRELLFLKKDENVIHEIALEIRRLKAKYHSQRENEKMISDRFIELDRKKEHCDRLLNVLTKLMMYYGTHRGYNFRAWADGRK